jgi:LDH2 family malate/lactate/ureidoglycolate dehydrogenase
MLEVKTYPAQVLHEFSIRQLTLAGLPADDAELAADVLLAADLEALAAETGVPLG